MLPQFHTIEEFGRKANGYIDCYVSTDADEVEDVLIEMGFKFATPIKKERKTLKDVYEQMGNFDMLGSSVRNPKTGLEIDCIDVPLEEALRQRSDIGFMPMSKFRVYTDGSPNVDKILLPIMKALDSERQNMAFINDVGRAYVKLSEFYQ